ncbi:MAG TPA: SMI1/KNR4 family protein [Thermodesulfobacteriota bacterium]|nr:SMI1/KNR4 family protein [Thermodesulfobacteriota bacterium]
MSSTAVLILTICLISGGSAILFYVDHVLKQRRKRKIKEESERYDRRMKSPDFASLETYFGHPLPEALKALYRNKNRIAMENTLVSIPNPAEGTRESFIAFFIPLDLDSVKNPWPGCEGLLPFADNGAGDAFLIDPAHSDPEVTYYLHEEKRRVGLGVPLSQFLAAPYNQATEK